MSRDYELLVTAVETPRVDVERGRNGGRGTFDVLVQVAVTSIPADVVAAQVLKELLGKTFVMKGDQTPITSPFCQIEKPHHEHEVYGPEGEEDWCRGNYPLVSSHGQWNVVLNPDDQSAGFIVSVPPAPDYYVESHRLYESPEHGGWEKHMAEKEWVVQSDFLEALAAARSRWPR